MIKRLASLSSLLFKANHLILWQFSWLHFLVRIFLLSICRSYIIQFINYLFICKFVILASGVPIMLLHEAEGHTVVVELKTGEIYRGLLEESEDTMNCRLKEGK